MKGVWICYRGLMGLINTPPELSEIRDVRRKIIYAFTDAACPHSFDNLEYFDEHLEFVFEYLGKKAKVGRRMVHVFELISINGKPIN